MPVLQPVVTRIGSGNAGFTDVYLKMNGGSAVIPNGLTMNNSAINLGVAGVRSQIYYDSGNLDTVIVYPDGEQLVMVEEPSGVASTVSAQGMASPSFVSSGNTKIPVILPPSVPTVIATLPIKGTEGDMATFRLLISISFAGGGVTYFADFTAYWVTDTSVFFQSVGQSSNFPQSWTITVPFVAVSSPLPITITSSGPDPLPLTTSFVRFG